LFSVMKDCTCSMKNILDKTNWICASQIPK